MKPFLDEHDVRAFIIGSGLRAVAATAARLLSSPHPILYDADRTVYRGYGLEKRLGLLQMSGTFVIDEIGILRHAHATLNPLDSFRKAEIVKLLTHDPPSG